MPQYSVRIVKPDQIRRARALFYGPSGHGKTTLLGMAQEDPRTNPMLIVAFEAGLTSLAGLDIDVVEIRTWSDYNQVHRMLKSGSHPYRSVGLDSISETHIFALLQQASIRAKVGSGGDHDLIDATMYQGDNDKNDPDMLQQSDYGKARVQLLKLLRGFRDLPIHVFMTAGALEETDVKEGMVKKPAMSGKLVDELPGIMDVVGYLALSTNADNSVDRVLILQNYPKIRAKIRTPWKVSAPDEIFDPTITKLLDVMQIPYPDGTPAQFEREPELYRDEKEPSKEELVESN